MATADRAPADAPLEFVPLSADRIDDLAEVFAAGGDAKWCWCASFRLRGRDFRRTRPADNRATLTRAAERADRGAATTPGLVAYREGRPVGWVSLGPREDYPRLVHSRVLAPVDDQPVWSIVCFVVAKPERGQGIARALLGAAVDFARAQGATMLEAYPLDPGQGRVGAAYAYCGSLTMFEDAGFRVVATRRMNRLTAPRPIVRLVLRP